MRIAPRMLLCASAFRVGGSGGETGFDELASCAMTPVTNARWRSA